MLLQNQDYQYRVECGLNNDSQLEVRLVSRINGEEKVLSSRGMDAVPLYLKVEAIGQSLRFDYGAEAEQWLPLASDIDGTILSTDTAGGFTGAYIGLFASGNGVSSGNHADFDYFEYIGL